MMKYSNKHFSVIYVEVTKDKLVSKGLYKASTFKMDYGIPKESEIFNEAVQQGKIYITKVDNIYEFENWYIYHSDLQSLKKEYHEKCIATEYS